MKCPSCRKGLSEPVERCPHCKFALRKADVKFGRPPLHSRYLSDRSGKMPLPEIVKLRAELDLFEKKFPQTLFSVFVTDLKPNESAGEYAFWLANRGRFSALAATGSDNFDLLLFIDSANGTAAFTIGYGLEKYLSESDLEEALAAAAPNFRAGDLAAGIAQCIEFVQRRLREISMQLENTAKLEPATY